MSNLKTIIQEEADLIGSLLTNSKKEKLPANIPQDFTHVNSKHIEWVMRNSTNEFVKYHLKKLIKPGVELYMKIFPEGNDDFVWDGTIYIKFTKLEDICNMNFGSLDDVQFYPNKIIRLWYD